MSEPIIKAGIVIGYLLMVAVNALANIIPINGVTTGEVSDRYFTLITPATYVFSIWGLIYLLLASFVIYLLLGEKKDNQLQALGPLFIISCLLNSVWMFAWHYDQILISTLVMLALLFTLIALYLRIDNPLRRSEFFFVRIPFSIYLGWISIATIANITILLVASGWNRWGLAAETWAVAVLLTGLIIAVVALLQKDVFYPLVFVWAYIGIGLNSSASPVISAAFLFAAIIGLFTVIKRKNLLPTQ